jgi:putative oxidoreductase
MRSFDKLRPLALLLLRWGLGIIFIYHGYPKLFTQTQQAMQGFPRMGFPTYFVYIAGVFEFFGGLSLLVGFATRISALLLAGEMAIAIWKVHLPQAGPMAVSNYQLPLALAAGAFALVATGAGLLSIDYAIFRDKA